MMAFGSGHCKFELDIGFMFFSLKMAFLSVPSDMVSGLCEHLTLADSGAFSFFGLRSKHELIPFRATNFALAAWSVFSSPAQVSHKNNAFPGVSGEACIVEIQSSSAVEPVLRELSLSRLTRFQPRVFSWKRCPRYHSNGVDHYKNPVGNFRHNVSHSTIMPIHLPYTDWHTDGRTYQLDKVWRDNLNNLIGLDADEVGFDHGARVIVAPKTYLPPQFWRLAESEPENVFIWIIWSKNNAHGDCLFLETVIICSENLDPEFWSLKLTNKLVYIDQKSFE